MERMRKYVLVALVLQLLMVVTGHFSELVRNLSGVFGTGIPLIVGWLYAARRSMRFGDASGGGLAIGAVGAAVGILLAVVLGDQRWSLLGVGTVSSAFTGWLGAALAWAVKGRHRPDSG
jgi:uncharacterized membrane protein YfcA